MMFFKNLSIRYKILIPVALLGVMLVVMGVLGLANTNTLMSSSNELTSVYSYNVEMIGEINTTYQTLRRCAFAHIIATDPERIASLEEEITGLKAQVDTLCKDLEANTNEQEGRDSIAQFRTDYATYLEIYDAIINHSKSGRTGEATELANNDLRDAGVALTSELGEMEDHNKESMQKGKDEMAALKNQIMILNTVLLVLSVVIFAYVVWVSWKWVVKRLININAQLRDVIATIDAGQGDLTKRVQCFCTDEIGTLASGINSFIQTLQGIMGHINTSSSQLGNIVNVVSDKVSTANDNSCDISSVMEELSASMEEIASTVADIKENVSIVDDNIIDLSSASEGLYDYATEMQKRAEALESNAVENKQKTSDIVSGIIENLKKAIEDSKSVEHVNDLTNDILSISSQTNLLSLNASIEAARAGEAGRGFAVVADEISQLANSSREAASNIQTINNMVVKAVKELIESSDSMVKYINENILPDYEGFVNTGRQYNEDAVHVNEIVTRFNHMSSDLKQLMEQITGSIEGINSAVDESANGVTNAAMNTSDLVRDITEIRDAMTDNQQVAGTLTDEADRFINL